MRHAPREEHFYPGLVRRFGAQDLTVGAPACRSWMRVRAVGHRRWEVTTSGPRDIWAEIQDVAGRWRAAGAPDVFRLHFDAGGGQRAVSPNGTLTWQLPSGETGDPR